MSTNSDYNKNRARIDKLLPEPHQSEISESLFENTLNRMLSPKETVYVDGYIGKNNRRAINSRQIQESTLVRQANQLQPILSANLGSEKKYLSWEDVVAELKAQGVNMEKFDEWGRSEKYNWVPPIDIDKLVHYQDYFWVDTNANSQMEYITIKPSDAISTETQWANTNKWMHRIEVENFASARQANYPIIEFLSGIEMNEYVEVFHQWQYRVKQSATFADTTTQPSLFELVPFDTFTSDKPANTIVFDMKYGDVTNIFTTGFQFKSAEGSELSVVESSYVGNETVVIYDVISGSKPLVSTTFEPQYTSVGDVWTGMHTHWVYAGISNELPTETQSDNPLTAIPDDATVDTSNTSFDTRVGDYAQEFITKDDNTTFEFTSNKLNSIAIIDAGVARVYVDGVRRFGLYEEIPDAANKFVTGIELAGPVPIGSVILIEVGPSVLEDMGYMAIDVRTDVDDEVATQETLNLSRFKRVEQVKTTVNQAPLFNVFSADGSTLNKVSKIFSFKTDQSQPVIAALGQRVVVDLPTSNFTFEQHLKDDEQLTTYKMSTDEGDFNYSIWRKSEEDYVPQKRDWNARTLDEYNTERDLFISQIEASIQFNNPSYTDGEVADTALGMWLDVQKNKFSDTGEWVGDWTMPDYMYYNLESKNNDTITSTELLGHFNSIIDAQDQLDGFVGDKQTQFHSIDVKDVDFGRGGTIRQYNNNFSNFLSSVFVDNVVVTDLIEFAQNRYENLLEKVKMIAESELVNAIANGGSDLSISERLNQRVNVAYASDSNLEMLYGDSTSGFKNWIATLPNIGFMDAVKPFSTIDPMLGLYEVTHHDGHIDNYKIERNDENLIKSKLIERLESIDRIVSSPDSPLKSFSDLVEMADSSVENFKDFFWHNTALGTLHYISADYIQAVQPEVVSGAYWFNTLENNLYISDDSEWNSLSTGDLYTGDSIESSDHSLWKLLDISAFVVDAIVNVESQLYSSIEELKLSPNVTSNMEDYFLRYTRARGIDIPFTNIEYNAMDAFTWNYYNSVAGLKFDMLLANPSDNEFVVDGLVADSFPVGMVFAVKNSGGNDGVWTVASTVEDDDTTDIKVEESVQNIDIGTLYITDMPSIENTGVESAAYWKSLYEQVYGTSYPHLEPWALQGYSSEPTWWNTTYKNDQPSVYGTRRWKYDADADVGMWNNIKKGIVPNGELLPSGDVSTGDDGEVTTYDYVSVNTENVPITTGTVFFASDDLLPPHFNHSIAGLDDATLSRSLFPDFNSNVFSPNLGYFFGMDSIHEYTWKTSSQYNYDYVAQQYLEDPIDFMVRGFGFDYKSINGLLVESTTNAIPSNKDVLFHGTIVDGELYKSKGLNQWYINFNRYTGVDTNYSNFIHLWKKWKAPLSYQFNSFIDVRTLDVNANTDIEGGVDYDVFVKKSNGVESFSAQGLIATLVSMPPKVVNYDNSSEWEIQLSNKSTNDTTFEYYPVMNYPFSMDVDSDTCTIYQYTIAKVVEDQQLLLLDGDISDELILGDTVSINNGERTLTIGSYSYNNESKKTQILVLEDISDVVSGDYLELSNTVLPWSTGDSIWLTTDKMLPAPLLSESGPIGPIEYYIIRLSDTQFQVANTLADAQSGIPIPISNSGESTHFVGQFNNTFLANNGQNVSINWRHYEIDRSKKLTFKMPTIVRGIQNFLNLVDGYAAVMSDNGFDFSDNATRWQDQIEKFIDYCYGSRNLLRNRTIDNRYAIKPNALNGSWEWLDGVGIPFNNGAAVNIVANGGNLPTPFLSGIVYYVVVNPDGTFNLTNSSSRAEIGSIIPLMDNGAGLEFDMHIAVDNTVRYPQIEVNSFKDRLSFRQPYGVVSNIIDGPFQDVQIANTILDQHGEPLNIRDLVIARKDKRTDIFLTNDLRRDLSLIPDVLDPIEVENYHYISSATLYLDTYEHVVEFNDYTTDGSLIYDGFVGLNLNRLNINFNKQDGDTRRPNIGGSSIVQTVDRIDTFDNIERSVTDLRNAYGSPTQNESNRYAPYVQQTVGYDINSTENYLSDLKINERSQFQFWQGLIQSKGSARSVDSFINSRQFLDARIDDFWAYQVAEYGSMEDLEYPELFVNVDDVSNNNIKFEFVSAMSVNNLGLDNSAYDALSYDASTTTLEPTLAGFIPVSINDSGRWYKQPDQIDVLANNGLTMYFESTVSNELTLDANAFAGDDNPLVVHNFNTDRVLITVDFGYDAYDRYVVGDGFADGDSTLVIRNRVLPYTNQISLVKNGALLEESVDFYVSPIVSGNDLSSNEIVMGNPLVAGDVIEVSYTKAVLIEDLHYVKINADSIQFKGNYILSMVADPEIVIYGTRPNFEAHNASKLIDNLTNTVVADLNLFDPARGMYNTSVVTNIDVVSDTNPATFSRKYGGVENDITDNFINKDYWGKSEVGTIWVDTSELTYLPYYDETIFPSIDQRLNLWGKQTDYSELRVWEWVESNVPPAQYDELAIEEQGDANIVEFRRKSGNVDRKLYRVISDGAANEILTPITTEIRKFVAVIDGVYDGSNDTYSFTLDADFIDSPLFGARTFDVYVNGLLRADNVEMSLTGPQDISVSNLRENDSVEFVHRHIVTDAQLDINVDSGRVQVGYDYTTNTQFDSNGAEVTKYYFWVRNKRTRARNNDMSAHNIEQQWSANDKPYIVLQNAVESTRVVSGEFEDYAVDFTVKVTDRLKENTVPALQLDTQEKYMNGGANGSFEGGENYQIGDTITLSNGAVVEVTNLVPIGKVGSFKIISAGDLVEQGVELTSVSTTGVGSGFSLTPESANIGGVYLNLNLNIPMKTVDDAPVKFNVYANNKALVEIDSYTLDLENRRVNILVDLPLDTNIRVEYTATRDINSMVIPARYTQAVIRNVREFITESNRYTVRFRKDFTHDDRVNSVGNKNVHKEWRLFRQHQNFKIDRVLWDKITESIVGFKLDDVNVRVPAINRELYDQQTSSDTRIGLGDGQAMTDGKLAVTTLMADLNNPANEFSGLDIASFFTLNNFNTSDDVINTMEVIYTNFNYVDVNRMFFLILNDALTLKSEYDRLLKTSMISVYGVKVLETQGYFDEY